MLDAAGVDTIDVMKHLLAPCLTAARHLVWYVSYQVTGETRPVDDAPAGRAFEGR
jgi:hypothetical protein